MENIIKKLDPKHSLCDLKNKFISISVTFLIFMYVHTEQHFLVKLITRYMLYSVYIRGAIAILTPVAIEILTPVAIEILTPIAIIL